MILGLGVCFFVLSNLHRMRDDAWVRKEKKMTWNILWNISMKHIDFSEVVLIWFGFKIWELQATSPAYIKFYGIISVLRCILSYWLTFFLSGGFSVYKIGILCTKMRLLKIVLELFQSFGYCGTAVCTVSSDAVIIIGKTFFFVSGGSNTKMLEFYKEKNRWRIRS